MERFENRFYPPLVCLFIASFMIVIVAISGGIYFPTNFQIVLASIFVSMGVFVAAIAVQTFRAARTTIHPIKIEKASSLVTSGIFNWSRNPMYLGMALVLVALAITLGTFWVAIGPIAFVTFITRFQIIPEERAMVKLFGQSFADYRARVRRWI